MKRTPNYYIRMLEIGANRLDKNQSITFNELTILIKAEYDLDDKIFSTNNFVVWFFSKFYQADAQNYIEGSRRHGSAPKYDHFKGFLDKETELKGDSYIEYIDYLELKEARKSSRQATWIAIVAIAISAVFALIQILKS